MNAAQTREQDKGLFYYLIVTAYVGLMTIAFFSSTFRKGIIPQLPTTVRYICDVGVIALAVLYYLVTYMKKRMYVALELAWVWSVPYIGIMMISLIIWIVSQTETVYISRGLINVGCAELNVLAAACAIWLFGKKAVDYTFFGAVAAVMMVVIRVLLDYGIVEFFRQYRALLVTFTEQTGTAMRYMEFQDLGHGLGIFLMYYTWTLKKNRRSVLLFAAALVCFTMSLKRIDVLAIAAALLMGFLINKLLYKKRWFLLIAFEAALVLFAYAYLYLIKHGLFIAVMDKLGINLMSRDAIFSYYANFYELSPDFLGRGVRFIYVHMSETTDMIQAANNSVMSIHAAHNEFITFFIELGFWGFIFWLWSNSWGRLNGIRRRYGWKAMTVSLMVVVYCFVSYTTDNTFFYYAINYVGFVTSGMAVLSSRKAKERDIEQNTDGTLRREHYTI